VGHAYVHWFQPGVTVRCIDLNSFDDFIRQVMDPEGERIGLPTLFFFPMQRVERIALDEAAWLDPVDGRTVLSNA